jgi:hypothetical protein
MWAERSWIEAEKRLGMWLFAEWPMAHPWNKPEDYPNFSKERYDMYNLIEFAKSQFPGVDPVFLSRGYFDRSILREYF